MLLNLFLMLSTKVFVLINMVKMMLTSTGKYDIYIALPTPLDLNFIDALNQ